MKNRMPRLLLLTTVALLTSFKTVSAFDGTWTTSSVFIENKGQFPVTGAKDPNILYAYDDGSTLIYFKRDGFSYSFLKKTKAEENDKDEHFRNEKEWAEHEKEECRAIFKRDDIFVNWENCNSNVQVMPEGLVSDYYNYAVKDDEYHQHAIENCQAFTKLIYKNLYNNIDVEFIFHANGGIKYSIIVHPGGDPAQVKMLYSGMNRISKDNAGQILITTIFGDIIDHAPVTFYDNDAASTVASQFVRDGKEISFLLGDYDHNKTIVIDPWQSTSGLGFGNSNKVWECEHDNAGNSYFWGGDTPVRLKKFNNAGTIQWTYNSPWDTANFWIGTLLTDNNGVSYITGGSNGEISKVSTAGALVWHNNPNGVFGPLFEYWHMAFNCDQTSLVIGGMRAPNPFSISNYRGVIITINMASGAVTGYTQLGWVAGINIKEVRSLCTCPSGGYYFLTLDSIGYVNSSVVQQWKVSSGYNFGYGNPSYAIQGNMGMSAIRANANFLYTVNGGNVQKRSIANGAVLATASIPGGISTTSAFGNTFGCSGLDLDSCGNVYVGSGNQIVKYDANLVQLSTQATPSAVYDVSVSRATGQVVACGNGFMGTYNMGSCNPIQAICITSTLIASSSQTNVSCFGGCNGTATASPSGGTGPYTYSWSPSGGNAATATGLCAGTYTCTVTDAALATTTTSVTITQPATAVSATQSQVNLTCNAACNGTATVSASGGTPGYTYAWSPSGGTAATATGLCANNYTCTITDANGCTLQKTFNITQPTAIAATQSQTNLTCNAACNGTATVSASGGTPGYTYSWSPSGGTAATATGLCANTYTCTITDANGCTLQKIFTITQPTAIAVAPSQTNITCNAACNGIATVSASGGTPGYTYSWSPSGGNAATATGLCANGYTCTITDANGCTATQSFNITQPTALTATPSQTNVTCNAACNGSATVSVSGGTAGYTYSWSPSGGNAATASSLCNGNYTCTITDANLCSITQTFAITQPAAPLTATATSTDLTCNAACNGTATGVGSGGTSPYSYMWNNSQSTATATALCAGNYTVTVTDANGCTTTQTATVTQPTAITASATSTPASCGNNNGSATASASGGTPGYTYSWSPSGGNAATANNLVAGNYTCTITDANGCTQTASVAVINTGAPTATLQSQADVTCNGGSNGTASVNVTGGSPGYTYAWTPTGGTTATGTGLSVGTYTCTVTDQAGCITTQIVTITEPTAIVDAPTSTAASCGNNDGTATSVPSGGTPGYTYSWSSGGTNATENNLATGVYTVTITDANGCTATSTVSVASTGGPTVSVQSSSDVTCFGGTNGSATVNASGNGPFTYSWSPSGGNAASATNLSAQVYSVTVTDAGGCTTTQTVTITEPTQLATSTSSDTASCGNSNGDATVNVTGGTGPYTYLWNNSQTTSTAINLAGGSYTCTITDANGCTTSATVTVANSGAPTVAIQSSSDVTCFGGSNGSATVNATGGQSPYTYAWSPTGGTNATATNLASGNYTVTVTGSDGCAQTQTLSITQPTAIQIANTSTPENCGSGDGSASATVTGGTPGYTYVWSNAASTSSINNLSAGSYTVTVTDANGCTSTSTAVVGSSGSATANAGTSVTITMGGSTQLNGTGGGTYSWSPSTDLNCPTCQNPIASPTVTTTYTLTVTDSLGCTATDTVTVFVDMACGTIYLPNAFSPNGDHENDVLYVRGNCIKVMQFEVYNRWGERVFATTDPTIGWDGTWRSKECEAAVFTYFLKATLLDGTEVEKQGNISLVK